MRGRVLLLLIVSALCAIAGAQKHREASPKDVVEHYLNIGSRGMLLTDDGWREASKLFLHPSPPPIDGIVVIVADGGSVNENWTKGGQAQEIASGYTFVGRMSPSFVFARAPRSKYLKTAIVYRLILIDTRASSDSGATKSEKQWKIENVQGARWMTVTAALQYLEAKRAAVMDSSIRQHIDNTISSLKGLK